MPIVAGEITRDGALVGVLVGVSQNRKKRLESVGFPVPAPVPLRLQLDSGSFATGLMPSVFGSLGIQPFTRIKVRTPSTTPDQPHECDQYDVSLTLLSATTATHLGSVHAIASEDFHEQDEFQGIIGRDVLDRCFLSYDGPGRRFTLAF